jgi:hypothetical protein
MSRHRVAPGWTTELPTRRGTYIILAVAGSALTLRELGRPEAPEFTVSLGEVDFTTLRSPGGMPIVAPLMRGVYTTPALFPLRPGEAW